MDFLKIFGREDVASKDIAKERLRLILVHDRANVSPKFLEMIKGQLINIISDYMEIEEDGMEIKLTRMKKDEETTVPALVANIPIKKMKHLAKI
ncbi:MAG: cell division topological specificity factor [Thermoanaerobacteraceae bacterium]|jgi:cell division topological specificity factor|uniref:Cell division topological specificity factor n=1 Tax=Biomaibacter acetigenes TaxID=2316383 RepID=A0A3G2R5Y3_9FIRM|nr:cell division topological specificity factor MinE [Biomaibacter acetigenes]AYO30974.1 cell division topological specificity factor MinE [Biomaibacter acetigenes]MDK2877754.1 cell division topological specificity factor [Thermoanaerobacteraceae bacterium]MDN5311050.1 cell division topological specificity factor [Thermoanaerobacteraceae bacterium]RKL63950.1 cell division topological specificity factor MinE [Thermoanaerobacteraceae bacterium SP2]